MRGRKPNANRKPYLRFPSFAPVGTLSQFRGYVEVARRATCELPGADEADPVVYASRPAGKGRRAPAELFYLQLRADGKTTKHGIRVYIKEVLENA